MIIVIADWYPITDMYGLPTGEKELLISHGIDPDTNRLVIMPPIPPAQAGAVYNRDMGEYVIQ